MKERRTTSLSRSLMPGVQLKDCKLAVVDGPDRGRSLKLDVGRITIGADPRCDLVLEDPSVSGVHAEAALMEEGVRVRDMGSTNGIKFLGNRITDAVLQPGSVVVLGRTTVALLAPETDESAPVERNDYGPLIGHSPAMRRLFAVLGRLERSPITTLVEGETGSGKTAVAEAIHERSGLEGTLVVFECGAVSSQLIQSELFGHKKGAFTGAVEDRKGAVEAASGGTLLLDEIGDLPLDLQPVLLRFLETGQAQVVGEPTPRSVDVRVIATTSHDLAQLVREGRFRSDLYYRVSVGRVRVPPLRERPDDILPLANHFLLQSATDSPPEPSTTLTPPLMALLRSYPWPGNVRQLRNAITRITTLGAPFASEPKPERPEDYHTAKAELLEQFERNYLEHLMRQEKGNLSAASRQSGLVRHHLRALLKKHGIDAANYREQK
jgi:DNA-binding NtrC family response regulator